ncbi:MAG: SpoIIE family protein phosphatase [Rhodobacteraceae bacterium]|nr:SpoIIE family protein phosphatase [Paracoccaceae bacterium]
MVRLVDSQTGRVTVNVQYNPAPLRQGKHIHGRALTVLVVDDSRLQRRLLGQRLENWGYVVFEAQSGRDALEICKATQVDLVISDWMMPDVDGLQFCRAFRNLPRESYGYFILLTSKDGKDDIAEGLQVGADDFLTKPVNAGELRARLNAGERVIAMQSELVDRNNSVTKALEELQKLYLAVDRDLEEARKLQHSLVPEGHHVIGNAQLSLMLRSSGHVGGDMIGIYYSDPGRIGLFALDVSGHGISSALMTARLAGCLAAANPAYNLAMAQAADGSYHPRPPDETAALLNARMLEEFNTDLYLTVLLADVDLTTGALVLVQAGHPHPAILRANGRVDFIGAGGHPVGLLEDAAFAVCHDALAPGDRFLIYSDGFTEAEDTNGSFLDEAGLARLLIAYGEQEGPDLLARLVRETQFFTGRGELADDLSAVLLDIHRPMAGNTGDEPRTCGWPSA